MMSGGRRYLDSLTLGAGADESTLSSGPTGAAIDNALRVAAFGGGINAVAADVNLDNTQLTAHIDASGAPRTAFLPPSASVPAGRTYVIIKTDATANPVDVVPDGGDPIAVPVSITTQFAGVLVVWNGSAWVPVAIGSSGLSDRARIWSPDQVPETLGALDEYWLDGTTNAWTLIDPTGRATLTQPADNNGFPRLAILNSNLFPARPFVLLVRDLGPYKGASFVATSRVKFFSPINPVDPRNARAGFFLGEDLINNPTTAGFSGPLITSGGDSAVDGRRLQVISFQDYVGTSETGHLNMFAQMGSPITSEATFRLHYNHPVNSLQCYVAFGADGIGWQRIFHTAIPTNAGNLASVDTIGWGVSLWGLNDGQQAIIQPTSFRIVAGDDFLAPFGGWLE